MRCPLITSLSEALVAVRAATGQDSSTLLSTAQSFLCHYHWWGLYHLLLTEEPAAVLQGGERLVCIPAAGPLVVEKLWASSFASPSIAWCLTGQCLLALLAQQTVLGGDPLPWKVLSSSLCLPECHPCWDWSRRGFCCHTA